MPRPIELKTVIGVLQKQGFFFVSQKGSHGKFRKLGSPNKTVIVKMAKKQIPHGTFQSILLQSGLTESDFRDKKK
ncbi:MAG: type II toxin-antitoxin system HicA family toxin [Parcubacteria group bacterium]|nr:type II toxin-antitoxin system HicA family toxin [Parcubacteria group bacterium]